MGAVESMLLACGAAQIGRRLGLPTQAYIALSDSKALDTQAGIETGMGGALAALSGINQISGPGMLDLGNCFSLEKLVVDHEVCAMAARLRAGISQPASGQAEVIEELLREGHLLIATDTRSHLRREVSFPGAVIDRSSRQRWTAEGKQTFHERVERVIAALLARYEASPMPTEVTRALIERMTREAQAHGLSRLPSTACEH
jgi:trimethylamine--corrinoid protein Co-methyltransferase